jgi:hypothetical protein
VKTKDAELFPAEAMAMDSPRLAWRKRHLIQAIRQKNIRKGDNPWIAWFAKDGGVGNKPPEDEALIGYGETEWDAITCLAVITKTKLWTEESI